MTQQGYFIRLGFSILIDVFDFSLGRIPIFGTVTDGVSSVVLMALWGPAGALHLWEMLDFTDQIDGFIPTATLIALLVGLREGFIFGKRPARNDSRDVRQIES